jgi:bifunctional DNA-binding transcriptional regulator/antitoxin component of YhaV-PrlF toxin-antitoxin module
MATTAKMTTKGQITLPKNAREALGSDIVEIEVSHGVVMLRPVLSQAGALRSFAKEYKPLNEVRQEVWSEVARDVER